ALPCSEWSCGAADGIPSAVRRLTVAGSLLVLALVLAFPAAGARSQGRPYLSAAQKGVADVRAQWWNDNANWYDDTYNGQPPSMPLARLASAYPLFATLAGLQPAQPMQSNEYAP